MPTRGGVLRLEPRRDGPAELIARSVLLEFSAAFIARYARRCRELSQRLWRSFRNASARFPRRSLRNLRRPNREDSKQRSSRSLRCVHREVSAAFIAKSPLRSSQSLRSLHRIAAEFLVASRQDSSLRRCRIAASFNGAGQGGLIPREACTREDRRGPGAGQAHFRAPTMIGPPTPIASARLSTRGRAGQGGVPRGTL